MQAVQAFSPNSAHFLDPSHLGTLADSYGLDKSTLVMECSLATRTLNQENLEGVMAVLHELSPLKTAFPLLIKLIQITLTIAVSTATCECSFSALKRIKTYLRSTMTQRLVDLAILSIERELSLEHSLDDVVKRFSSEDKNRRISLS